MPKRSASESDGAAAPAPKSPKAVILDEDVFTTDDSNSEIYEGQNGLDSSESSGKLPVLLWHFHLSLHC